VFTTKYTPPGFHGLNGVVAGSVFSVLAFGGFEGAAPLAEEARNPARTIRLAVLLATLSIGALYVFTTYAADVAFGPGRFASFTTGTGSASWEGMARAFYGLFWILVFLAIVNSTLANSNAGVNVSSRTAFAMGRIKAFPHQLGQVSAKHRSPVNAIMLGGVISLVVMLALGFGYDPVTAFAMVGTAAGHPHRRRLHPDERRLHRVLRAQPRAQDEHRVARHRPGARHPLRSCPRGAPAPGSRSPGSASSARCRLRSRIMGPAVAVWMLLGVGLPHLPVPPRPAAGRRRGPDPHRPRAGRRL